MKQNRHKPVSLRQFLCQLSFNTELNSIIQTFLFFEQVKATKALLDLHGYGRTIEDSTKLLRSMETLSEEDDGKEEREGKKKGRETDSGTYLSVGSNKDDVDNGSDDKLPVTNLTCDTTTSEVQRKEEPPFLVEEKRFMVYICGGYKGKNDQISDMFILWNIFFFECLAGVQNHSKPLL